MSQFREDPMAEFWNASEHARAERMRAEQEKRMNQDEYQPHHDATVTADDIRQDASFSANEAYAEAQEEEDEDISVPDLSDLPFLDVELGWSARLASRAAAIVSAAGGLALALSCLAGTPASASTLPLVPTDGECVITHQWDDGSAIALCGPNDAWAYDADGNNPPESSGYTGPRWDAGWYPCVDASCARIDHAS